MDVLMIAAEAAPFIRTGDVSSVVTGLALQLRASGHDVRLVIPHYRSLTLASPPRPVLQHLDIPLGAYSREANISRVDYTTDALTLPVYLVDNPFYFRRDNPYGYLDDYERFVFFTRAAVAMLRAPGFAAEGWQPQVLHGHDWYAGLVPLWLRRPGVAAEDAQRPAFVYTLHNADYPGEFSYRALQVADLTELGIYTDLGETTERVNFMARGVLAADAVNTVSPTHAEEIKAGDFARQLQPALQRRPTELAGILNGLDASHYDAAFDPELAQRFNARRLQVRRDNKLALQRRCGFPTDTDGQRAPLLGIISRLTAFKGYSLLESIMPALLAEGVQLVIAGAAEDHHYREVFHGYADRYPRQVAVFFETDDALTRRVCAGADIILVPSRREPCGLQQMIAMRYGAVPVVRRTGGLADTVAPVGTPSPLGSGFVFDTFDPASFLTAVRDALKLYRSDQHAWEALQRRNLEVNLAWERPADQYVALYQQALETASRRPALQTGQPRQPDRGDRLTHAIMELDELPMSVDLPEYLKQVARVVRELLASDTVIIWTPDSTAPPRLRPGGWSVDRLSSRDRPPLEFGADYILPQQIGRAWQSIYRRRPADDVPRHALGYLGSEVAKQQGWTLQLSVPITTHGMNLGQMDIFPPAGKSEFDEWAVGAATALASTLAINLERVHLREQAASLLAADREMAQAETVRDIAQVVLQRARELAHADTSLLHLPNSQGYGLDAETPVYSLTGGGNTAAAPSSNGTCVSARVPLGEAQGVTLGEIEVVRPTPRFFTRDEEMALRDLAAQSSNWLQAARLREQREQREQQREQQRVEDLGKLAASLVGGGDFAQLLDRVVTTTAQVLEAQAASLYLINEDTGRLEIKAAAGYHLPLLQTPASYAVGEGTTGWLAQQRQPFKADSLDELHDRTPWQGKHRHLQAGREPAAFLGLPLKIVDRVTHEERVIGVLKLEDRILPPPHPRSVFTEEDVRLGEMMGNVIATVVYNALRSERRLHGLSTNLAELSRALAGSRNRQTLMENVVNTIGKALKVDAASLFLADETHTKLVIQAAYGYQKPLVAKEATYKWGEGVTGHIAKSNRPFLASSLTELRQRGGGSDRGTYDHLQGNNQPQSFYGLPLNVVGRDEAIGVLKLESLKPRAFTEEDILLIQMMANVISTVVYNAQLEQARLSQFSANLAELSRALAGSQNRQTLMENVVNTIGRVLGVDAASLFLADESNKLVIQAAYGYQEPLVARKVAYDWGQGVTGRIAQSKLAFGASSLEELRKQGGGSDRGTYDHFQGNKQPQSFYGLPLNVTGRDKPIGVLKLESLKPRAFAEEDIRLIQMMANVISTVVYNAQLEQARLSEIIRALGPVTAPREKAARELLERFAASTDRGILELVAGSVSAVIGQDCDRAYQEAVALAAIRANPELLTYLASHAKSPRVERRFDLFYQAARSTSVDRSRLDKVYQVLDGWAWLEEVDGDEGAFAAAATNFIQLLGEACGARVIQRAAEDCWRGYVLEMDDSFSGGMLGRRLAFIFHRQALPQEGDFVALRSVAHQMHSKRLVLPLWSDPDVIERTREMLRNRLEQPFAIETVVLDKECVQRIVGASQPAIELQRAIVSQVNLVNISPYITFGPTNARMFFGREQELSRISEGVDHASFAVIGGRRIGKTSILQQLHQVRLPSAGFRTVYHDCSTTPTDTDFITHPIGRWQPDVPTGTPATYGELLQNPPDDKRLVLLLDEADRLIANDRDHDWSLFNRLRDVSSAGEIQIVLSGEWILREAFKDGSGPLYNLANPLLLGPLHRRAVEELVTGPMRQLEIELRDAETIVQRIFDFTSGHPRLVQIVCTSLIERLNQAGRRSITVEDVEAIISSPRFQRDEFLPTFWRQATVLERMLSLLMAKADHAPYTPSDARDLLDRELHLVGPDEGKPTLSEVQAALDRLVDLRTLLEHKVEGYTFAVAAFPVVVREANVITIDDLLQNYSEVYRHKGDAPEKETKEIGRS